MYDELVKKLRGVRRYTAGALTDMLAEAADAIEGLEEKWQTYAETLYAYEHPWIPVTERLPESAHEFVLCCGSQGGQFVGWVGTGFDGDSKVMAIQQGGKGRYITHWMPLPEPPKGD